MCGDKEVTGPAEYLCQYLASVVQVLVTPSACILRDASRNRNLGRNHIETNVASRDCNVQSQCLSGNTAVHSHSDGATLAYYLLGKNIYTVLWLVIYKEKVSTSYKFNIGMIST